MGRPFPGARCGRASVVRPPTRVKLSHYPAARPVPQALRAAPGRVTLGIRTHRSVSGVRCLLVDMLVAKETAHGQLCRQGHTPERVGMKPVYLPDDRAFVRYIEIPGEDPLCFGCM